MVCLTGKGVSGGVAFGRLVLYRAKAHNVSRFEIANVTAELTRLEEANKRAAQQLAALYEKALSELGQEEAEIFEIHQMMLEDEDYAGFIQNKIKNERINAEFAVHAAAEEFSRMFEDMDNTYMQARANDVRDVSDRLLRLLVGDEEYTVGFTEPSILAAAELTPSQTLQMDKTFVRALITEGGSQNSHAAILARTMNLPAVVCVEGLMQEEYHQADAIVDGDLGKVYLEPDASTTLYYQEKLSQIQEERNSLERVRGLATETRSGKKVHLCANVGAVPDIEDALRNDAEGIGLFRSEFIFLKSEHFPTEDEQYEIYRQAAEKMAGKPVVIRTLDIGADKQLSYFPLDSEENPALGIRGVRVCLAYPHIFKTQLRAIYRASAFGKVAVMVPMIISAEEMRQVKAIVDETRRELRAEGIAFDDDVELGAMIETPAAALISGELAAETDFFSIGTNDLIQYTLAVDRQNQKLENLYDPHHGAVLELIRITADNAHKRGIWVGICGDLAADLTLTDDFLRMGIDELSVVPPALLGLRNKIRGLE